MGIDFGAVSSGISVAYKHHDLSVYTVENITLTNNKICKQIPTSIVYEDGDINNPDKVVCNLQESKTKIYDKDIHIKNIKQIAYGYDPLVIEGLTPKKIVADYLRCIHDIAVQKLKENKALVSKETTVSEENRAAAKKKNKDSVLKEYEELFKRFEVQDTRYCIACPEEQQTFMGQCFIEAGIILDENELKYRLHFVTESEATAYNLLAWDRRHSKIKPSENYLVCNLGHTSLGVSEIQASTTDFFSQVKIIDEYLGEGSMLLDLAFSRLIQEKDEALVLGDDKKMTKNFEWNKEFASEKKYGFYENDVEEARNDASNDFPSDSELNEHVFEPVTTKFVESILSSMKKGEKANGAIYKKIYITGRYGYDSYFFTKLREYDNQKYRNDVVAIEYQMVDSVSRGAVYYAMRIRKEESQIPFFDVKESTPEKDELPIDLPEVGESDLIVGIDFGTTFSGISYAYGPKGEINSFNDWPKSTSSKNKKCPSVLLFKKKFFRDNILWGYSAQSGPLQKDDGMKLQMFKLSLASEAALKHYRCDRPRTTQEYDFKKKMDAIENFLKKRNLTEKKVIGQYLKAITDRFYERKKRTDKTFYVLTVPAMWNEDAKRVMVEAFKESGVMRGKDNLLMITEPEAAAISYDEFLSKEKKKIWKTFLVCDAGGGTVDLVTFRTEQGEDGQAIIRQLERPDGELCGSTCLDEKFKKYIEECYDYDKTNLNVSITVEEFKNDKKPSFHYSSRVENERPLEFTLPAKPVLDRPVKGSFAPYSHRKLRVPYRDLVEDVFNPVIEDVITVLEKQKSRLRQEDQPEAMLLVGGFSGSNYLQAKLEQRFQSKDMVVKRHPEPLTAISEGAVSYAQNPRLISSKLILQSYAIEVRTEFQNNIDLLRNRTKEKDSNGNMVYYSNSRLEYFVYARDPAKKNHTGVYKKRVYVEFPKNAIIAIFASDRDREKNKKEDENENENEWRYVDPKYHYKSMEIVIEMPSIPNAKPKDKIPFMITLEIDEIKGLTVSVQCEVKREKGEWPKYQVQPKIWERSLGYFCESNLGDPKKARKDNFFPSKSIN